MRRRTRIKDNFESGTYEITDGQDSPNGVWHCEYAGGGVVGVIADDSRTNSKVMRLDPALDQDGTRACRIETNTDFYDFECVFDMKTVAQNRVGPNNWEVAWCMFRYTVTNHHYSFLIQANGGCELSKKDFPEVIEQQVFLETTNDSSPSFSLGQWFNIRIRCVGYSIKIWVDGILRIDIIDEPGEGNLGGQPYMEPPSADLLHGKFCFYVEDAQGHYDNFAIRSL